jgi:two-component system, response regulator
MGKTPRILIAEDEVEDLALVQIVLEGLGLQQEMASVRDGVEALDYLYRRGVYSGRAQGHPDLLLLDLKLHKVSGLEVLRQIRAEEGFKAIRVVIFSSSLDERDRKESLACGADEFVVKPINFEAFQDAITRVANVYITR